MLVIGAGVNGSICAVKLHNAGVDVTVLARGKRYKELVEQGIVIENPFNNIRTVTKVPVIERLDPQDRFDYILVIVRKNQVAELFPVLRGNCSPNVVFMVNNPSGPEEFIQALGRERVMLGFVFGAGKRDGSVIYGISESGSSLAGRLWPSPFGEVDDTVTPKLKRLVGILRRADLPVGISRHISDYLTTHAALVAPLGGIRDAAGLRPCLVEALQQRRFRFAGGCDAPDAGCAACGGSAYHSTWHSHSKDHPAFPVGGRAAGGVAVQIHGSWRDVSHLASAG